MTDKQVRIPDAHGKKLEKLIKVRRKKNKNPVLTINQRTVLADLIDRAHEKECK